MPIIVDVQANTDLLQRIWIAKTQQGTNVVNEYVVVLLNKEPYFDKDLDKLVERFPDEPTWLQVQEAPKFMHTSTDGALILTQKALQTLQENNLLKY